MSREMGLEHKVQFIGYIEDTVRNALYNYAELAVFPSLYEPFGIVALEGMATKTPVVVSDTGGLREIVKHEKNGLLFPPGDGNALARQIIRLLKESGLAKRLAENAYHYVLRDYTWSGVAQKTLGVYQEILEESGKSQWQPYFVNKINANDVLGRYDY
jgi:glycogen(starch) synthase